MVCIRGRCVIPDIGMLIHLQLQESDNAALNLTWTLSYGGALGEVVLLLLLPTSRLLVCKW